MILFGNLSRAFLVCILVFSATCRADLLNQSVDQLDALINSTFGKGQIADLDQSTDLFDQASSGASSDDIFFEDYEVEQSLDLTTRYQEDSLETIVEQKLDEKVTNQDDGLDFDQWFEEDDISSFDENLAVESTENPFNPDVEEVNSLDAPASDESWDNELFSAQEVEDDTFDSFNEVLIDTEDQSLEEFIPEDFDAADSFLEASEDTNFYDDAASLTDPSKDQTSSSAIDMIEAVEPVDESLGDIYDIPIELQEMVDDVNAFDESLEDIEFSLQEPTEESIDDVYDTSIDSLDIDNDFAQESFEDLNVFDSTTEQVAPESTIEEVDTLEVEMMDSADSMDESLDKIYDMSIEEQEIDFSPEQDVYDEYDYEAYEQLDDPWDSDQDLIFDNEIPQVNEDLSESQDLNDVSPYGQTLEDDVTQEDPQTMSLKDSEKVLDSTEPVDPYSYELDEDLDIDDIGSRTVIDLSESMEELDDLAEEADQEDMFRDPVDTVEEMKELYSDWVNVFADEDAEHSQTTGEPVWLKNGRYRLKIGDRLLISIYGAGGTTQEVVIDFTGSFNYLLIGEVFALGKTVDEIRDELNEKVREIFRFAFISVTPVSFEGHYFTILGEVNTPGKKTLRARTTLLGAICQAGGFKSGSYRTQTIDIANLKHAFLARNGEYIPVDFEALVIDGDVSEDVVLQSQDYIYIPSSLHREISILGEVSFPTTIGFLNEVTLAEAISQARGVTPDASSRVVVIRGALSNPETYLIDFNRIVKGYEKDFRLAPGDIVYVPPFKLKNFRDIVRLGIRSFVSSFSGAGGADLFEAMVPDSSARRPDLGGF